MTTLPCTVRIRPGTAADRSFVRDLSTEAFAPFGDYRELLPRWTAEPGVLTLLAEEEGQALGFAMVGFYYGTDRRTWCYADVLAIAVVAPRRNMGIGQQLLRAAVDAGRQARGTLDVRDIRLTVADTNLRAQALFAREGFARMEEEHGRYDKGQVALRMARPL